MIFCVLHVLYSLVDYVLACCRPSRVVANALSRLRRFAAPLAVVQGVLAAQGDQRTLLASSNSLPAIVLGNGRLAPAEVAVKHLCMLPAG